MTMKKVNVMQEMDYATRASVQAKMLFHSNGILFLFHGSGGFYFLPADDVEITFNVFLGSLLTCQTEGDLHKLLKFFDGFSGNVQDRNPIVVAFLESLGDPHYL